MTRYAPYTLSKQQKQGIEAYIQALETLKIQTVRDLSVLMHPTFHFIDPFNDVTGPKAGTAIFTDIFRYARSDIIFKVNQSGYTDKGVLITWRLEIPLVKSVFLPSQFYFTGMSEIEADPETGLITKHYDHWDAGAQFYMKIPGIGLLLRTIRKRAAVHIDS